MNTSTNNTQFNTAIINDNIPVNREFISSDQCYSNDIPLIDAIYIPTLGLRHNLVNLVSTIEKHCQKIYILLSGKKLNLLNLLTSDKIVVIENINNNSYHDFLSVCSSDNPSIVYDKTYDIPTKRNFALTHSVLNNHKTIGLIDDDITITDNNLLKTRNILLGKVDLVGFYALTFPDVSTIDHIERYLKKVPSPVSIGGNCLFFKPNHTVGFFPYIYNEDWIFIFTNMLNNKNVIAAGYVSHLVHKPWESDTRIRFEQFGEVIITGLKLLISNSKEIFITDLEFWKNIYNLYYQKLKELIAIDSENKIWLEPLSIAMETITSFTAKELLRFTHNYKTEREHSHFLTTS